MNLSPQAFKKQAKEAVVDPQLRRALDHVKSGFITKRAKARARLPEFSGRVRAMLAARHPEAWLCDYGHWGDGGSHLCVLWRAADVADGAAMKAALQESIYELTVREFGGSYSAEHGVGPHNQRFYDRYADATVRELCRALRSVCDPSDRLGTVRLD